MCWNLGGIVFVGAFTEQPSQKKYLISLPIYFFRHGSVSVGNERKYFNLPTYRIIIELLNNNSHGLSPPGGLVSPSGGFLSLLCDQDNQDPVVRCHCL